MSQTRTPTPPCFARHKAPSGPFDVKLMKGGLVDIEFIVQARALMAGAPVPPRLEDAIEKLVPKLAGPARLMMDMLVMLRLVQPHDDSATPTDAAAPAGAQAAETH